MAFFAVALTTMFTLKSTFETMQQINASMAQNQSGLVIDEAVQQDARRRIIRSAIQAALISTALAIIIAGVFTHRLTRPLNRLATAAQRLTEGERGVQLPVSSKKDEIQDLTLAFNELTISLARQEAWRRGLIADIAHDLRTPLSVMRSEIEAIQDGIQPANDEAFQRLHGEVLLLARLVTDLRLLSLAESGALELNLAKINVLDVLNALANAYKYKAAEANMQIRVSVPSELSATADPDRLRQTLQNLLDNALRYAAPNQMEASQTGLSQVELQAKVKDGQVQIMVRDYGPGFPPEALARAFERFYRTDSSRTRDPNGHASSGLGLAIARALTEAQGGRLQARNHPEGGAEFSVWLQREQELASES